MIVRAAAVLTPPTVGDALELDVRIVAWDTPADVSDDGRTRYTETWQAGSLIPRADGMVMPVYAGHLPTPGRIAHGPLIGRLDNVRAEGDGLYGTVVLADTAGAREVHALARTVGATVSLEADTGDAPGPTRGRLVRTAARPAVLTGVAVITLPATGAIPGAAVLAARADVLTHTDPDPGVAMNPDETTSAAGTTSVAMDPPPAAATPPPHVPDAAGVSIARADVAEMIRQAMVRVPQGGEVARVHPLAQYRTLGDYALALQADVGRSTYDWLTGDRRGDPPLAAQIARVLVDQITTDNPGVIPPAWISDVFGIVEQNRAVIDGIGTRSLPDSGMELNWPYFDGDLSALVGEQVTQKTDIVSVKVSLKRGTEPIRTFAGGSDLAYQLIRRSSPSYRETYLRIMSAAYAWVTDAAAATDLTAGATGSVELGAGGAGVTNADLIRAAIFEASVAVETATGSPASVVLMATDQFVMYGSVLMPSVYGTQNVAGTADASTLNVNVSGLRVVHAPRLAAGTILVTNGQAAFWSEDGPFVIAAPDVSKLGENVAIWGMGALAIPVPAGVVKIVPNTPLATRSRTSS